jgi:hypothetical protein
MKMRQSQLDRQDQLDATVNYNIPQAFNSLYELDRQFNLKAAEYKQKRLEALEYIKELNRFEDQLSKSLGIR